MGCRRLSGKVLVPFLYDHEHMNMRSDEWVECLSLNGKNVQINLKTGKVDTCNCSGDHDDAGGSALPSPLVAISKRDKFGVADTSGRIIVPCVYDQWFGTNRDSTLLLSGKGKRDILLDLHGKPVLPPGYDTLVELNNGLIKLTKHGLFGLYNPRTKKIIVPGIPSWKRVIIILTVLCWKLMPVKSWASSMLKAPSSYHRSMITWMKPKGMV